jgi:FixJ family two-component response regulator
VVLDLHMPEMSGFEIQSQLAQAGQRIPVVTITGHDTPEAQKRVMDAGAAAYLRKPVNDQVLLKAIMTAIQSRADTKETDLL